MAFKDNRITWVKYFRYRIDQGWHHEVAASMTEKERLEFVLKAYWRYLVRKKDFERNGYRRRVWRRLALEKFETRRKIRRMKKNGLAPEWVLT